MYFVVSIVKVALLVVLLFLMSCASTTYSVKDWKFPEKLVKERLSEVREGQFQGR